MFDVSPLFIIISEKTRNMNAQIYILCQTLTCESLVTVKENIFGTTS